MGPDGLGSAAQSLGVGGFGGGGRVGGGSGDFMQVLRELIRPGAIVKKGANIAEFDRENMLMRVDDFKTTVAQAEASVQKLKAELDVERKIHQQSVDVAKAALDKARLDMKTAPVRSDIDTERLKLALEEAEARYKELLTEVKYVEISQKADLRNAEIELQQAGNELKRIQGNADRMIIKSPMDGMTVMQNMIRGGEMSTIQQGDQLYPGQMFMQVVDPRSMVVNATLNQVDVERIRVGQKAHVRFDAYPDLVLPAHVTAIGAMTKPGGQRANFFKEVPLFLKLDQIDSRVIPDLSVSADVVLSQETDVTVVPRSALFDDAGNGKAFVFVRGDGGFEKREVELGLRSHIQAAVKRGLQPGETVALDRPVAESSSKVAALTRPGGEN
jgi:multidrug efflux pump subunit AcrA (membrane-fusion protein)